MIYSLINVTSRNPDGTVNGYWIQDHSGDFDSASEIAKQTNEVNHNALDIAICSKVNSVTPQLDFFTNVEVILP